MRKRDEVRRASFLNDLFAFLFGFGSSFSRLRLLGNMPQQRVSDSDCDKTLVVPVIGFDFDPIWQFCSGDSSIFVIIIYYEDFVAPSPKCHNNRCPL